MPDLKYKIYWLTKGPHCEKAVPIRQVDGVVAWVCRHEKGLG